MYTDGVAVLSSNKPHLRCNRNSANSLSVRSENRRPFSLSIQPLTAFAKLSYGKRDFAEVEGRKTEIEERCMRRRRGGGRGKKFNAGPEGRNLAKETGNQRRFA